jgi:hypothetical protein
VMTPLLPASFAPCRTREESVREYTTPFRCLLLSLVRRVGVVVPTVKTGKRLACGGDCPGFVTTIHKESCKGCEAGSA